MTHTVFVDGQEGTTGLRIHEMLARRPDIEFLRIDADRRKDAAERARLLNAADVAFLCLPDDAAREAVSLIANPSTCVIDASTAHRTAPGWVFGLPELAAGQRALLRGSKRISNPGCHASAFILLLRPLVDAGLVSAGWGVSATSITGYSGGGKKMIERYQAGSEQALTSPRPYALSMHHKHVPEMQIHCSLVHAPLFAPAVAATPRGMIVDVPLFGVAADAARETLREALLSLRPEIYGTIAEEKVELSGLLYVIERLPVGIEECRFINLTSDEGYSKSHFKAILKSKSNSKI